ncbi:MAG: universal stress protein, partial [Spirochaetaceae bacterium]|nr:universal stress protein [Spirochaetaceae bacterium]
ELGLFSQSLLSGAVFLIIASCVVGSFATQGAGRKIAQRSAASGEGLDRAPERILVAISNPGSIRNLIDLSFLLRDKASKEPIYPIAVIPESADAPAALAEAENHLAQAVVQSVSAGLPVIPTTRVAVNVSEGILQAAHENRASTIVIGWNKAPRLSHAFFGNVIDHVILGGGELVVVARIPKPVNNVSQVFLVLPPFIERHPGFGRGITAISSFLAQTGARLTVYAQKPHGAEAKAALGGIKSHGSVHVVEFDSWKSVGSALVSSGSANSAFALCSARPGESSWHPAIEKLPHRLGEELPDSPLLLFYLPERKESGGAEREPEPKREAGDLLDRAAAAGRLKKGMSESAIVDGIRELLSAGFGADRKALGKLTALFTEIAQKQPIELEPGILLLHAHVEEASESMVFFGSRAEGFRLLALEESVKVLIILCAPLDQPPEEHLETLGEIARLFKDDRARARLGLEPEEPA